MKTPTTQATTLDDDIYFQAIKAGNIELIHELFNAKPDLALKTYEYQNTWHHNIFHLAFFYQQPKVVSWLLSDQFAEQCPGVTLPPLTAHYTQQHTLFSVALSVGDCDSIVALLRRGAPTDYLSVAKTPAWITIALSASREVAKWLLSDAFHDAFPDINLGSIHDTTTTGNNVLGVCIRNTQDRLFELFELFVNAGAKLDHINPLDQRTLLHELTLRADSPQTIDTVLKYIEHLPSPDLLDSEGKTALELIPVSALKQPSAGVQKLIHTLLPRMAEPHRFLTLLFQFNLSDLLDDLLTQYPHIQVALRDGSPTTVELIIAGIQSHPDILRCLVKHGAQVHQTHHDIPLYVTAASHLCFDVLDYLISDDYQSKHPNTVPTTVDACLAYPPLLKHGGFPLMLALRQSPDEATRRANVLKLLRAGCATAYQQVRHFRFYLLDMLIEMSKMAKIDFNATICWLRSDAFRALPQSLGFPEDALTGCYLFADKNLEDIFRMMIDSYIEEIPETYADKSLAVDAIDELLQFSPQTDQTRHKAFYMKTGINRPNQWQLFQLIAQIARPFFELPRGTYGPQYDFGFDGIHVVTTDGSTLRFFRQDDQPKRPIIIETTLPAYTQVHKTLERCGKTTYQGEEISKSTKILLIELKEKLVQAIEHENAQQQDIKALQDEVDRLRQTIQQLTERSARTDTLEPPCEQSQSTSTPAQTLSTNTRHSQAFATLFQRFESGPPTQPKRIERNNARLQK